MGATDQWRGCAQTRGLHTRADRWLSVMRYFGVAADDWVLGIDVDTSRSAGAMANGAVTSLEIESNNWMPSMVLLDPNGTLVVGSAADYQAGVYPDRVERTPKRHLGRDGALAPNIGQAA